MDNAVKEYVCHAIGVPFDTPDDFNYRKAGKVDSLGVVRLVLTLESHYCIVFSEKEISRDDFSTVGGLASIIEGKLS